MILSLKLIISNDQLLVTNFISTQANYNTDFSVILSTY